MAGRILKLGGQPTPLHQGKGRILKLEISIPTTRRGFRHAGLVRGPRG